MKKDELIKRLYDAGWDSPSDAQHTGIDKLWRELFPVVAELEDELEGAYMEIECMQDLEREK